MRLAGDAAADGRGGPVAKHAVRAPRKKVCAFCKDKDQNIDYKGVGARGVTGSSGRDRPAASYSTSGTPPGVCEA